MSIRHMVLGRGHTVLAAWFAPWGHVEPFGAYT
jgi:hypothetical protein